MKILLAGGAGFILSNFSTWLLQHTDVNIVTVDNLSDTPDLANIEAAMRTKRRHQFYLADIANTHIVHRIIELESPDIIIYAVPPRCLGLYSLCQTIMNKGDIKKLIVIDDKSNSSFKNQIESYRAGFNTPIDLVLTDRIYGSRQSTRGFVAKTIVKLLQEEKLDLKSFSDDKAEWLYIRDFFDGIYSIIEKPAGNDYTITSGFVQTHKEIAEMLSNIYQGNRHLNVDARIKRGKEKLYDASELNKMGWQPRFGLLSSLEHTLSWYSDNRWAQR